MKFCSPCHQQNPDDANFCHQCGAALTSTLVTAENFSESLEKIANALTPGTPVMFDRHTMTTRSGPFPAHTLKKYLFYSDGTITSDGEFRFQKGKRTDVYTMIFGNENPEHYLLHTFSKDCTLPEGILLPHSDTESGALEGRGTNEIIIGDSLRSKYRREMAAMDFARNAINVIIDDNYVTFAPIYHTHEKFKGPREMFESLRKKFDGSRQEFEAVSKKFNSFKEEFEKFENNFNEYALITAARNLLSQARIVDKQSAEMEIVPFERYTPNSQKNLADKYSCDVDDFVIRGQDGTGTKTDIAMIKIAHRLLPGQLFVLPAQGLDGFVESAFSEKAIAAYYPKKSNTFL